jgi:hypothetical protein
MVCGVAVASRNMSVVFLGPLTSLPSIHSMDYPHSLGLLGPHLLSKSLISGWPRKLSLYTGLAHRVWG